MPRNGRLGRAVSVTADNRRAFAELKTKTMSPSLIGRWKSFRGGDARRDRGLDAGESPPGDEAAAPPPFFGDDDRDRRAAREDELSVRICRDTVRHALLEHTRMESRDARPLLDAEAGRLSAAEVGPLLAGATRRARDIFFLWCAFVRRPDLLEAVERAGVDLGFALPGDGLTALHLAAFVGCARSARWLVARGCDVDARPAAYAPLHCAVLGNCTETVELLLRSGAALSDDLVHTAVRANAVDCLALLLRHNVDVNALDAAGVAPLHVAADRRLLDCLRPLLAHSKVDVDVVTRDRRETALHLAAEGGHADCVAALLAAGADPAARDSPRRRSPLHLAARAQSAECAAALLRAGADVNAADADGCTPLRASVGKAATALGIVETLLDWNADVNAADRYGFTALHVAALNELSQCVDALIWRGADVSARTRGGLTPLSVIGRKTPACLATVARKLDASISLHDPEASDREVELELDFRYLLQRSPSGGGEVGLLKTLVDEGQKGLLEHPLCSAFLCLKWQKVRRFYFCRLFVSLVFVALFTAYVLTALAHNCYNAAKNVSSGDRELCVNNSMVRRALEENPHVIRVTWYLLAAFTAFEILRKLLGLAGYNGARHYLSQWSNLMEWFTVVSVFAVSFVYTDRTYNWQNHVGAFGVLCAWTNLMVMVGQHPVYGTYVAMFTKVQGEFAKLFIAYVFLLVGFTISFCVIFPTSQEFRNPLIGFVKVLVMTTGELDMGMLNASNGKNELLDFSAHIIYAMFVLFVSVVLMNLLVGIAVHDIQGLHKTAGLSKLVRQTELISFLELSLFHGYVPRRFAQLLRWPALVAPSAYRVVLHVRPLNPRETRLPKHVLAAAYEVARQRKQYQSSGAEDGERTQRRPEPHDSSDWRTLSEEVQALRQMLSEQQQMLRDLLKLQTSATADRK